ncbi:MAG: hypothetical protein WAL24_09190, partial [Nitrososphaeraceae archaeon]
MKVHAQKAFFVILLISVIASVSNIFFSSQALLNNAGLRPGGLFSVFAQEPSGDEEEESSGDEEESSGDEEESSGDEEEESSGDEEEESSGD